MAGNSQFLGAQPLRPAVVRSTVPPQNFGPPMPMQFRPVVPAQQTHQFIPAFTSNIGMPSDQTQIPHFPQSTQHLPPRSGPAAPPSSQAIPMPYIQPSRPMTSGTLQPQQNPQMPNLGGIGMPLSSSYTFTSYGQPQHTINTPSQYQPASQMLAPVMPAVGQAWSTPGIQNLPLVTPLVQAAAQSSAAAGIVATTNAQPSSAEQASSDWQVHTSDDGKRYYYNNKTRQSSWEKPLELMTPIERADASTDWKEFSTADGRTYYYNKITKVSKWIIPEELKLAREQALRAGAQQAGTETGAASVASAAPTVSSGEVPPATASMTLEATSAVVSSPVSVATNANVPPGVMASVLPSVAGVPSAGIPSSSSLGILSTVGASNLQTTVTPLLAPVSANTVVPTVAMEAASSKSNHDNSSLVNIASLPDGASAQNSEEATRGMPVIGRSNATPLEEKTIDEEPLVYANKQEAKNAFKDLLESANVESDWTWEQAMRVIISDKRYGVLKTLGERKQAFNEYLGQRKKQEAEERRIKQKKAREDFTKMLEECKELTSSTRWSKAVTMFENDERFNAVERARDREDLFESYLVDLQKKERAKAAEEHKQNIIEYRAFLESCDFIRANSQWRKVRDRLEDDERCSRLEKIDRLEIFQEYIHDLEKEEEEQQKIQKDQLRRQERKNRDEFRRLMEGHVGAGILTAKTHWRDYCMQVKDLPPYKAVASNTSGSTPKDLFEDVAEELDKQYHEDKVQIKEVIKIQQIALASPQTFEDLKAAISADDSLKGISEINMKLVFNELLERLREEEEKEAKKRQRLADNFSDLLYSLKEITASSIWEDCKTLFEDTQEYRSIGEENFVRGIFEEHVARLLEKLKEKERKREEEKAKKEKEREEREKRKEKGRKEKEKGKEKEREREKDKGKNRSRKDAAGSENVYVIDIYDSKDEKREKDKERKQRKHHHSMADDVSSEKDENEESKKSHRHSGDRKKSRKHTYSSGSDGENRHKRHKKDQDGFHRNGGYEDLEDGELGEDGEIC